MEANYPLFCLCCLFGCNHLQLWTFFFPTENGASHAPCDITFAGPRAFSELETQHFRDYVLDRNKEKTITTYLTLHSYGRVRTSVTCIMVLTLDLE